MPKEIIFQATRRNEDETVILIFTCTVSAQHTDAHTVVSSIKEALTNWAISTPEGKKEWEDSCLDFNFADLSARVDTNGTAGVFLQKAGIFDIQTKQIVQLNEFNLDTILMDGDKIEAEDLHAEIRTWLQEQGLPQESLDEIELDRFSPEQMEVRNAFLKRFDNL